MSVMLLLSLLQGPKLGTVHFPNSGAPAAQEPFIRGVAYLHSFEYDSAAKAFREAQQRDPAFALAYWGEAMTYTHPVWDQQDAPAARAILARAPAAATPRERGYLDAARVLYGDGPKPKRDTLYAEAMQALVAAHPEDQEASAFYALALLGLNQGVRDVPTYMKAAAIAEEVFRANPDHPGAAHYLIHSYDDPAHAEQGLPAARAYSKIAPGAAHAQHMTTHIFLALGMWDDVVKQNEIASGPDRNRWVAGHYTSWLGYGLLQQGKLDAARSHLEAMRTNLATRNTPGSRAYLANMRAQYLINSERWRDPVHAWALDVSDLGIIARAVDAFGLGFAAARRGERATAQARLADLQRFNAGPPSTGGGPNVAPTLVPMILARELEAAILLQERPTNERALVLLREATALEDSLPVEYGPPDVVKPSHELLGEAFLALGRFPEARQEYERALAMAPGRRLALIGLAWAQKKTGNSP